MSETTTQAALFDVGSDSPITFAQWQEYSRKMHAIADRVCKSRQNRGWALAITVGIGRCGCSLHNASIAEVGKGWGAVNGIEPNGRRVIRVARAAKRLIEDLAWEPTRIADRATSKAWDRITWPSNS